MVRHCHVVRHYHANSTMDSVIPAKSLPRTPIRGGNPSSPSLIHVTYVRSGGQAPALQKTRKEVGLLRL